MIDSDTFFFGSFSICVMHFMIEIGTKQNAFVSSMPFPKCKMPKDCIFILN